MAPTTPYTPQLGGREPIAAMRATAADVRALTQTWTPADFERTYAPGKWTARQILTHLAQTELALGSRARLALGSSNYVAQPFDQDSWIRFDAALTGREAADAFVVLSGFNAALYGSLSRAERDTPFSHPEYGALTVDWIIHQQAGHQLHHLAQLKSVK
jgi:hypothetical protein